MSLTVRGQRYEVSAGPDLPILRLAVDGAEGPTFTADGGSRRECFYEIEAQRGYDSRGWLWSPGYFAGEIRKDRPLTLIAATEPWHTVLALSPDDALTFEGERRRRLVGMAAAPAQNGFGGRARPRRRHLSSSPRWDALPTGPGRAPRATKSAP